MKTLKEIILGVIMMCSMFLAPAAFIVAGLSDFSDGKKVLMIIGAVLLTPIIIMFVGSKVQE